MKLQKRILALLFTVVLALNIIVPVNASVSTTTLSGEAGSVVTFEYTYHDYAGIQGTFTYSNPELFSKIEILVPGLIGEYNESTNRIAYFGMTNVDITVKVVLTISKDAVAGSESTIDFNYRLANEKGEAFPYVDEQTVTFTVIEVPKLDYTKLIELINKARSLNASEYTAKTWAALQTALEAAIKAQEATTQTEINDAASALEKAINALEKIPNPPSLDFEELLRQIKIAEGLNEKDYTASSWSNMKKALSAAKAAQSATSQSVIDTAAAALRKAIASLVKVSTSKVDYTALNKQIAIAEGLKESDYTTESWAVLNSAYIAAISARGSNSQSTVDKATDALRKAISNLVPISNPIDYTELNKQIAIAKGMDPSTYTNESFEELTKALKAAELALKATTQEEVDKAAENLRNAIAKLIKMQLSKLLEAIESVKGHISGEKLAQLYKELFDLLAGVDDVLASGDQEKVDELALKLITYLDAINKELEELKKPEIVEIEKVVEVEPTGDYCNIPSHRIYIILFWISLALNIALIALIVIYLIKKNKTGDDTPIVDYDIADDSDIPNVSDFPMIADIPTDVDTSDESEIADTDTTVGSETSEDLDSHEDNE